MRQKRHLWVLWAVVGVTGSGCMNQPAPQRWEGQFVTLTSSEGVELCSGTLPLLDRFVDHNYRYWTGGAPPQDLRFEFDLRVGPSHDGLSGKAFFDKGTAWAGAQYAVLHELTHLVVGSVDGRSAPVLTEGVAEALGPANSGQWDSLSYQPEEFVFLTNDEFMGSHYLASAQLIRFWIRRYGVEAVRDAYVATRFEDSSKEIEAGIISIFGDDLYDGLAEFAAGPQCALQAWECGDTVLPVHTLPVRIERTEDCRADAEFFGAVANGNEQWYPMQQFVLELTEQTSFLVETDDNASVQITTCVESCAEAPESSVVTLNEQSSFGRTTFESHRPAGRYIVTVHALDLSLPFSAILRARP